MQMTLPRRLTQSLCVVGLLTSVSLHAADPVSTRVTTTQPAVPVLVPVNADNPRQQALDQEQARVWGLTLAEVLRAHELMRPGLPRSAFSAPNLSPVEALGIAAQTESERRRYAELFARAMHADTVRVVAWSNLYAQTYARLYPNEPVMDFGGQKLPPSKQILMR